MRTQARVCPAGCAPLAALPFRGVTLDRCGVCAGVWFDAREYEMLSHLPEAALRTLEVTVTADGTARPHLETAVHVSRGRRCPNCDSTLRAIRVSSRAAAVLDYCDRCFGYWADDAQLAVLSELLESDKPYFAPALAESARRTVADALEEVLTPHQEMRLTLFQSVCLMLTRPIGNPRA